MASLRGSSMTMPPHRPESDLRESAVKADIQTRSAEEKIRLAFGIAALVIIVGVLMALFFTVQAAGDAQRAADAAVAQSAANEEILKTLAEAGATRQMLLEQSREADNAAAKRAQLLLDVVCSHVLPEVECGEVFVIDGVPVPSSEVPPTADDLRSSPDASERRATREGAVVAPSEPAQGGSGVSSPPPAPSGTPPRPAPTSPAPVPAPAPGPIIEAPLPRSPLVPEILPSPLCVTVVCIGGE